MAKNRKPPTTIQGQKGIGTQDDELGRPTVDVDFDVLVEACKIQCTKQEAAALCKVSEDTLDRRLADMGSNWTEFFTANSAGGRASLRRWLHKSAEYVDAKNPGNVTAQIWLSKQHLGMKDRNEVGFDPEKPAKFILNMGKTLKNGEKDDDE